MKTSAPVNKNKRPRSRRERRPKKKEIRLRKQGTSAHVPETFFDKSQSVQINFGVQLDLQVNSLMESFTSICKGFKVSDQTSSEWLENLKRQYSEESRHYHDLTMIEGKLKLIEELAGDEKFRDSLVIAILFQYYNYDVKSDLKKENCDAFRLFIEQSGIKDETFIIDVLAMLGDETVTPPEGSSYQIDLFNDLDLAVLGSSPDDYASYTKTLQAEYGTESYQKDRLKMLKTLLMIPTIYTNAKMREKFESVARENVQREIEELRK